MINNQLRKIKQIVYKLNRLYGTPGTLRRVLGPDEINFKTGLSTQEYSDIPLTRMIVLPVRTDRSFEYDLSYIAVAKNFTVGAYYERDTRQFIIEDRSLPLTDGARPIIKKEDKIIAEGLEYEIKQVDRVMGNFGYLIIGVVSNKRDGDTHAG